jgi:fatty acid-binding protein DegV
LNVEKILNKAKEGDLDELVSLLNKIQRDVIGMVSPETLLYLKNGGRISNAEYIAGSLLKIKPIVIAYRGAISEEKHGLKLSKAKGKGIDKLINKMFDVFEENERVLEHRATYEPFIVSKGEFEREFYKEASEKFKKIGYPVDSIKNTIIGGAITAHLGPNVYMLGLNKKI